MSSLDILDKLSDPVRFNAGAFGIQCAYVTIKVPIDKVRIEYYDRKMGDVIDEKQSPTRWRAITDIVDSIRVKSYRKYNTYCELDIMLLTDDINPKYHPYLDLNNNSDEGYVNYEPLQDSGSYRN